MGWFSDKEAAQAEVRTLNENIVLLKAELEGLNRSKDYIKDIEKYEKELERVKTKISDMKIEKDQLEESFARERRETEHSIGLLKLKQDQEAEHSKRMALLEVREGNLQHEKQAHDDMMKFREKQFDEQFQTLNTLTGKILERLPNVNYDITENRDRPQLETGNNDVEETGEEGITARRSRRRPKP